jgi:hypothetical protein
MAQWRRWGRLLLLCGALVGFYFLVPVESLVPSQDEVLRWVGALLFFGALGFLVVRQLRFQLEDAEGRRIDGLVAVVVAVVLAFALSFYVLEDRRPGEVPGLHTRVDALYFAMTTLLTVGYGDIHAEGQTARVLVVVQLLFNGVFLAAAANVVSGRVRTVVAQRARARVEEPPAAGTEDQRG